METATVHLFVFNSMADWEPAFAIVGINNPRFEPEPGRYRVQTAGPSVEPILTMGGSHCPRSCSRRVLPDLERLAHPARWPKLGN